MPKSTAQTSLQNMFQNWDAMLLEQESKPKPLPVPIASTDPLAMSCYFYRQRIEWGSLSSDEFYVQDKEAANKIREYYKNVYLLQALKGRKLTTYQQDVTAIVTGQRAPTSDDTGLLHRLPYLYTEDVSIDHVAENTELVDTPMTAEINRTFLLTPITSYRRYRRSAKGYDFWFKTEHNKAVRFYVSDTNPLLELFSTLFDEGPRKYKVTLRPAEHISSRNFSYYIINTIALA